MDHMRIPGIESSSVFLISTESGFKIWKWWSESFQTSCSQKGWCEKPTKLQFQLVFIWTMLMLSKRYVSTEVNRRTWLHGSSETNLSTSGDAYRVVKKETSTKIYTPF